MSDIQSEITRKVKGLENMTHNEKENQMDPGMTQSIELVQQALKLVTIFHMFTKLQERFHIKLMWKI